MTPNVDKVDILDILNDAKDVVTPKVDKVDINISCTVCEEIIDHF
jgi:predicted RNA-binding protein